MRYLFVIFICICSINVAAQIDTVYINDQRIICCVTEINTDNIKFIYPGETAINSIEKSEIQKIAFQSGRAQVFSISLVDFKEYTPNILSALALIASIIIYLMSVSITKKNNSIPALIDYLREWRGKDGVIESYHYIRNRKNFTKKDVLNVNKSTLSDIKDTEKGRHAVRVSHYFENLGLLIYSKVLDGSQLVSFVGGSAYNAWITLEKYIKREREINKNEGRDGHYQIHFQYFVSLHLQGINKLSNELDTLLTDSSMESLDVRVKNIHDKMQKPDNDA